MSEQFDFNWTCLAPTGTQILIHDKTWNFFGARGRDSWYITPALQHYICFWCINPSLGRLVNVNTVEFIPHNITFSAVTAYGYTHSKYATHGTDHESSLRVHHKVIPPLETVHHNNVVTTGGVYTQYYTHP